MTTEELLLTAELKAAYALIWALVARHPKPHDWVRQTLTPEEQVTLAAALQAAKQ